ncbi:MAG: DUF6514 family protein [Cellulosilyticaceae bacterium]
MQIYKELLGTQHMGEKMIKYYIIQREKNYGIELEEERENKIVCDSEYFTRSYKEAYDMVQKMKNGMVSLISMCEILDDYIQ